MSESPPSADPRVLRAIAHPIRARILDELAAQGSLRAADVARALGIAANSASFHLRQLAKYGVVREAEGGGRDRRERVWVLAQEDGLTIDISALENAPGGKAAARVWGEYWRARAHVIVDAAFSGKRPKDSFSAVTNESLRLTKAEAQELAGEIEELLQKWGRRTRSSGAGERTYLVFSTLQPYPERDL